MSNATIQRAGKGHKNSREPLKVTLTDIFAVVFGFACLFALPPTFNLGGLAIYGVAIPLWLVALVWFVSLLQGMALGVAAAVVVRRITYGRMPRPAEWLALAIAMHFLSTSIPTVDTLVEFLAHIRQTPADFEVWRWAIAGIGVALSVIMLLVARQCTDWLRTILLCAMITLLMWGPCAVVSLQFSYLFPSLDWLGDGWTFWFSVNIVNRIGAVPLALLFGLPAVATILARRADRFRRLVWTEWVAMAIATALGLMVSIAILGPGSELTSIAGITEYIVEAVGLMLVAVLSLATVKSGIARRVLSVAPR